MKLNIQIFFQLIFVSYFIMLLDRHTAYHILAVTDCHLFLPQGLNYIILVKNYLILFLKQWKN